MKKVYLFCNAGMSTSMLAQRMQGAADEHNLPVVVDAYSASKLSEIIANDTPDCILLGPQVKHMSKQVEGEYGASIPVGVIDSADYGALDGERVLKYAIVLMKQHKSA